MIVPVTRQLIVASAILLTWAAPTCHAELQPAEVVIIAARGNRESEGLAKYYARMPAVPPENICLVDVPKNEECPRNLWRWGIRPEINKWLVEHDPKQGIKCLVTVWGVPLKIGPADADPESLSYRQFLEAERAHRLKLLSQLVDNFQKLAAASATSIASETQSSSDAEKSPVLPIKSAADSSAMPKTLAAADSKSRPVAVPETGTEIARLRTRLEAALQSAQTRASNLPPNDDRARAQLQMQQWATAAGGIDVLLPALKQNSTSDAAEKAKLQSQFDGLRGRLAALMESKQLLEQMPAGVERDVLILAMLERAGGLIVSVEWLDQQLDTVKKNETGASFDSELALVMWSDGYQLLRWQSNYLRPSFANSQLPNFYRTLMVSRIDAPTLQLAKGIIDTSIDVEKKGLHGTVYIDARGLAKIDDQNQSTGSYGDYDRSLLLTAKGIEKQTDLKVVLEDTPELFQHGQCPDAALYCGWYSLAKYVDAFDWVPGAVAYHLASSEASTLRDPASEVWCKKLLEHGVCATIGPVYEPYLVAFPRPDEFFALLLRGDLTLVECYTQSNPFNSWMMTLIGDPLYRPFKYRTHAGAALPTDKKPSKPESPPAQPSPSRPKQP